MEENEQITKKQKVEREDILPPISYLIDSVTPKSPLSFVEQPDSYQISNYNIQPLIVVEFAPHLRNYAFCIDLVADYRIEQGFYQTYKLSFDGNLLSFPGLKLNTMKHLKEQAKRLNTDVKQTSYRIEVTVGGTTLSSNPFKIVSSFSQLPTELQQSRNVRLKKVSNNKS